MCLVVLSPCDMAFTVKLVMCETYYTTTAAVTATFGFV